MSGFPGRKMPSLIPWKMIGLVFVLFATVFTVFYVKIKSVIRNPIESPRPLTLKSKINPSVPDEGVRLVQKTGDNVKQILSGKMLNKPKERQVPRKYVFMNNSTNTSEYYKDAHSGGSN